MSTETETRILNIAVKATFRFDRGACSVKKRTLKSWMQYKWGSCIKPGHDSLLFILLLYSSAQTEQQKLMYIVSYYRKEKYDRSSLNILTDPLVLSIASHRWYMILMHTYLFCFIGTSKRLWSNNCGSPQKVFIQNWTLHYDYHPNECREGRGV
jgi:hypothetical protein